MRKYLPPGNLFALYWVFVATFTNPADAPGFVTFWQVYTRKLRKGSTFRRVTQHSKCTKCWKFIQILKDAAIGYKDKCEKSVQYQLHLMSTQYDRICYWSARAASRMYNDILVIIIDAMDRSKTIVPRVAGAVPKALDKLFRPCVQFVGAICHGWNTTIYVTDERCSHGSNLFLEILIRSIDLVYKQAQRTGRPMPSHLWVQSDNTPSQAKNCPTALLLCWLVARCCFKSVSMMFLQVGHTHEDIGPRLINTCCDKACPCKSGRRVLYYEFH